MPKHTRDAQTLSVLYALASKKITLLEKRVEKLEEEEKRYKKTLMLAKTNSIALWVHFKGIEKLRKVPKRSPPVSLVRLEAGARDPQADPAASELVCNAAELTEKPLEQNLVVNEAKSQSFGPTLAARSALAKARSLVKQIVPVECGTGNTTLPPIATPRSIEKNLPEKTSVSASGKGFKDKNKELFESKATGNPASKPRAVKLQTAKKPSFDPQCEDVVQGKSPFVLNRFVLLYLVGVKVNKPAYLRAVLENGGLLVNANSVDKVKAIFTGFKGVKTFDNYLNKGSLEEIGERLSELKRRLSWVERFKDNPPVRRHRSVFAKTLETRGYKDGRKRLDVTVKSKIDPETVQAVSRKHLGEKKAVRICTESYTNLRLLTLNVNSFGSKREETLRYTRNSRNVIPGYEVFESFAKKEEKDGRGLILAVRRKLDLTLSSFKLLVVNVYIPPKCSLYGNRAKTLEALGSFLVSENKKNGLDDILVMGDWNMTPEEAARFLAVNNLYCTNKWLFEAPRATRAAAHVEVQRKWDISDHLPVTVDFVEQSLAEKLISCPTWNSFGHNTDLGIYVAETVKEVVKKLGLEGTFSDGNKPAELIRTPMLSSNETENKVGAKRYCGGNKPLHERRVAVDEENHLIAVQEVISALHKSASNKACGIDEVVERRMRLYVENNNLLCREQAGFRTREECVAQVATLLEIQRRRFIRGDKTTSLFPYNIGLRQGCPLSPLLFDLFIDEIFRGVNGITCEGLNYRVPGLLFADETVLFGDDVAACNTWGTRINIDKCRLLLPPGLTGNVRIGEKAVPVVETYRYLGIVLNRTFSLKEMLNGRKKAVFAVRKMLCHSSEGQNKVRIVSVGCGCENQPSYEKAAMSRVRGFLKSQESRTIIRDLLNGKFTAGRERELLKTESGRKLILETIVKRQDRADKSVIGGLLDISGYKWIYAELNNRVLARSMRILRRFRIGLVKFSPQLAALGSLPIRYRERCLCCEEPVRETVSHLVFVYKRWKVTRRVVKCLKSFDAVGNLGLKASKQRIVIPEDLQSVNIPNRK
ncbi:hypothetical protein CWI38_0378p0010 [Hamiltosporidium tvaerminnensis]|uniref:Reverse transcriptase domain-containing protein n=1 Tax=Hamiltosporidium tvaerminnensis TaxID=1176355 RepID=A0A4Q9M0S7_9MICR|nr:hypothetical protein CWI38_0378p0010 [Hamiltosporidium tvaerminnensis]